MSGPARLTHDRWAKIGGRMDKNNFASYVQIESHISHTQTLFVWQVFRGVYPTEKVPGREPSFSSSPILWYLWYLTLSSALVEERKASRNSKFTGNACQQNTTKKTIGG